MKLVLQLFAISLTMMLEVTCGASFIPAGMKKAVASAKRLGKEVVDSLRHELEEELSGSIVFIEEDVTDDDIPEDKSSKAFIVPKGAVGTWERPFMSIIQEAPLLLPPPTATPSEEGSGKGDRQDLPFFSRFWEALRAATKAVGSFFRELLRLYGSSIFDLFDELEAFQRTKEAKEVWMKAHRRAMASGKDSGLMY